MCHSLQDDGCYFLCLSHWQMRAVVLQKCVWVRFIILTLLIKQMETPKLCLPITWSKLPLLRVRAIFQAQISGTRLATGEGGAGKVGVWEERWRWIRPCKKSGVPRSWSETLTGDWWKGPGEALASFCGSLCLWACGQAPGVEPGGLWHGVEENQGR